MMIKLQNAQFTKKLDVLYFWSFFFGGDLFVYFRPKKIRMHFTNALHKNLKNFSQNFSNLTNLFADIPRLRANLFVNIFTRVLALICQQVPLVKRLLLRLCWFLSQMLQKHELCLNKDLNKNSSNKNENLGLVTKILSDEFFSDRVSLIVFYC